MHQMIEIQQYLIKVYLYKLKESSSKLVYVGLGRGCNNRRFQNPGTPIAVTAGID